MRLLFDEIESQVDGLSGVRDKTAGTIRISASDNAIPSVSWPKLQTLLQNYPDIRGELIRVNGLSDIVAERFDAGTRMDEQVAKDMISAHMDRICGLQWLIKSLILQATSHRHAPRIFCDTAVSTSACRHWVFIGHGSSKTRGKRSIFEWKCNSPLTIAMTLQKRRWPDLDAYVSEDVPLPIWRVENSSWCWKFLPVTGRLFSTILTAVSPHQPSPFCSRHCFTEPAVSTALSRQSRGPIKCGLQRKKGHPSLFGRRTILTLNGMSCFANMGVAIPRAENDSIGTMPELRGVEAENFRPDHRRQCHHHRRCFERTE